MSDSEFEYDSEGSYVYESDDGGSGDDGEGAAAAPSPPQRGAPAAAPAAAAAAQAPGAAATQGRRLGGAAPQLAPKLPASASLGASDSTGSASRSRLAVVAQLFAERGRDYRVFGPDAVRAEIAAVVRDVASVLEVAADDAEAMLLSCSWDRQRLLERYMEAPENVRAGAGLAMEGSRGAGAAEVAGAEADCPVCFASVPASEMACLACGHAACRECWGEYLSGQLRFRAAEAVEAVCMESDCSCIVPHAFVRHVGLAAAGGVDPTALLGSWDRSLCRHFVEHSRRLRWCPGSGCDKAFQAVSVGRDVECESCGSAFCLGCGRGAHRPVTCSTLTTWLDKCEGESETANWIIVNTKRCPKCSVRIEKNQGCMHMKCRVCKHEFCWVCTGDWAMHGQKTGGYYACNRYDAQKASSTAAAGVASRKGRKGKESTALQDKAAEEEERAKAELDRYLFYFQRYSGHMRAGTFAARQRERAQQRMAEVAAEGLAWVEVDFIEQGTEVLLACRRVLQFTYVMAYYMEDGREKSLFEHLQELLEGSTEELSELLERPLEEMDRRQVVNFTRVTAKFLSQLLEGVDEGLVDGASGAGAASAAASAAAPAATAGGPEAAPDAASLTSKAGHAKPQPKVRARLKAAR